MIELPAEFIARMSGMEGFEQFLESYKTPPARAIRVNTLKISVRGFKEISPFSLEQVPWEKSGFYVESEGLGKTLHHAAGLYYVQEPSAMSAAPKLEVKGGERVLDLCSAPGGKGTQLAQYMNGEGILFLNEINFSRAKILSSNVERLGIKNAVVTCAPPEKLAESFKGYFDKVLVDAPCSGEGMFKKERLAIPEWSLKNVYACAERQSRILDAAAKLLSVGGTLVYSTCTFAPEEDEEQISDFIYRYPQFKLVETEKLFPHKVRGEGHFYAVLKKLEGVREDLPLLAAAADRKAVSLYREWESAHLNVKFERLYSVGSTLYSLPEAMPKLNLQTLRCGVRLGELTANRFEPCHSLAMCLKETDADFLELDEETAFKYLGGLTFDCESANGWKVAAYKGFPLGWCKVSGGVAKNRLPKAQRI